MTTDQLPLPIELPAQMGREDFLVSGSNDAAFQAIDRRPDWPSEFLVLTGPEGAGKSHLAAIFSVAAGAPVLRAVDLTPQVRAGLGAFRALAIEDCDGVDFDQATMFHLVNDARLRGASVLFTARTGVSWWRVDVPDLASRLRLAPEVALGAPDDALLRALFVKLFLDRQLLVDLSVIDYAMMRIERSCAAANALVARLDRESLARQRRVTKAIVAGVLPNASDGGDCLAAPDVG